MHIDIGLIFATYVSAMYNNVFVEALAVIICADMVFGSLRAIRERKWNSAVGIDGGIRKVGMVSAVLLLTALDMVMDVNLIGWVGEDVLELLSKVGIVKLGITELFALLFFSYEVTSVCKNMLLCGIPIPVKIRQFFEKFLNDMTEEMPDSPNE